MNFDVVEAIKARYLPIPADLEVEAEAHHTWDIENWKSLNRREHGPTFECGGYPWCVWLRGIPVWINAESYD